MPYLGGLVSISFRKLTPAAITTLVAKGGLSAIEWGGDIHVPHGDTKNAKDVATMTADAGLVTATYGSYYRLGVSEQAGLSFGSVLETAVALGAPAIRVWAGQTGSSETDEAQRAVITQDTLRCAEMAGDAGVGLTLEYHANTLTDCDASAMRLLNEVPHSNLTTLWQPINRETLETNLTALTHVLPRLLHLHVFQWEFPEGVLARKPLATGADNWQQYLSLAQTDEAIRYGLLEFIKDDSEAQFLEDAGTLSAWLASC